MLILLFLSPLKPIKKMDKSAIKDRVKTIASRRQVLIDLLENPSIGTLRVDVDQALEELDELIEECEETFPD